jgi:polysaccharide biosynthesis/export protein
MNIRRWSLRVLTFGLILFSAGHSAAGQEIEKVHAGNEGQPPTVDKGPQGTLDASGSAIHKRGWHYTVHPSDVLTLTFPLTPELTQSVTVQPDGYITLQDVGIIPASGQTLPELTDSVKKAYAKILHDPLISIDVKDFEKPYITVGGQVGKPGKFDWRGDVTVMEAIAIAGGFLDQAKHSQVLLFRRVSDQWAQAQLINVKQMIQAGNLREDPILQPGDMLYVPKNWLAKIKPWVPIPSLGMYSQANNL